MLVSINGELKTLPDGCSIKEMLGLLFCNDKWFGVAINMKFVPKEEFEQTVLQEGDEVDVLSPTSGG